MSNRTQLFDDDLVDVTGGQITYTWDGTKGTIGMNGRNPFILVNKSAFIEYYNSVKGEGKKDSEILNYLLDHGIAVKPTSN